MWEVKCSGCGKMTPADKCPQLMMTPLCKPCWTNKHSSIAQLVEQVTVNHPVPGSSPGGGVCLLSSEVEHLVYTEAVGGSIPSASITTKGL